MEGLLPGFEPLPMRCRNDCGPTAMLQIVHFAEGAGSRRPLVAHPGGADRRLTYEDILRAWRLPDDRQSHAGTPDRFDTPGHHLRALRRLGMRSAFRRRLGRRGVARTLDHGFPVVLLLPTGTVRWHWIVACGRAWSFCKAPATDGGAMVSAGDGEARRADWDVLDRARLRHAASRLLGIEGLGYVVAPADRAGPLPFATDVALERDILRLARVAEEALLPLEPLFVRLERLLAKIGWKRAAWGDIFRVGRP